MAVTLSSLAGDVGVVDPEVAALIREEERRQATTLMMIPSENYSSLAVRQAQGSIEQVLAGRGQNGTGIPS